MQRVLAACLALSLVGIAAPTAAQEISFDRALALGEDAPDVRGAERALEARRSGDARISDLTHATEIQLTPGVRILSEQDQGFEGQISIGQGWNLAGLPGARRRAAEEERGAMDAQRRALALSRRLDAARAWIELRVLEGQVAIARQEQATADELAARIARAADAGVLTQADAADARSFAGDTELAMLSVEAQRLSGALALAGAMGTPPEHDLRTAGAPPMPELPPYEALEAALLDVEELPDVVSARLASIAARAREVEIAAAQGPTLGTAVQVYREAPSGLMVFGQITIGLPLVDLGARDRAVALADAELRAAEHEARALVAMREGVAIAHEVDHARRERAVLAEEIVPALEQLVTMRERQLEVGETTVVVVLDARRRRLAARARLEQAEGALRWAEVRAWLMLAARQGLEVAQ